MDYERETLTAQPGIKRRTVRLQDGTALTVPEGWAFLKPGDAALTRKVKKAGPSWTVQVQKGRKKMSRGVWAPAENIEQAQSDVVTMRSAPDYKKKLEQSRTRRKVKEERYAEDFESAVGDFLRFDERYQEEQAAFAAAVAKHATPVGSGTVARTKRIPIEERAEAAVIAWMRHQTSAYDHTYVPKVKGARRELRRKIAERSRALLRKYRAGEDVVLDSCPLYQALQETTEGS